MCKSKILKQMFSVATLAMMFGVGAVYAQADKAATGTSTESQAGKMSPSGSSGTGGAAGGSISKADQKMMSDLARANIAEIEAGKLAQSKSQNEQVKAFAQKMIDDHTSAQQELQQLAQAKGVTLPDEPDMKHKARAKILSSLSGTAFDRRYMAQGGLADHKATHQLLQRVQTRATDPELKALAAKIEPTVNQHLTMAQQIQGGKAGASSTSGTSGATGSGATGGSTSGGADNSAAPGAGGSSTGGTTGGSSSK